MAKCYNNLINVHLLYNVKILGEEREVEEGREAADQSSETTAGTTASTTGSFEAARCVMHCVVD